MEKEGKREGKREGEGGEGRAAFDLFTRVTIARFATINLPGGT